MNWRKPWMALVAVAGLQLSGLGTCATPGSASIPFRPEESGGSLQAALVYGGVVLLLALTAAGLLMLRKRLGIAPPAALAADAGLKAVASLRLHPNTVVHLVACRGREVLFVQAGGELLLLAQVAPEPQGNA